MNHGAQHSRSKSLGARPEFYLIYLLFYIVPWFAVPPSRIDVLAFIVGLVVFIPVYFSAFKNPARDNLGHVLIIALIGYALSPFNGSWGVFHIYAVVQAAYTRPERRAWFYLIALEAVFLAYSLLTGQSWWIYVFPLFIAFVVGVGCIYSAEQEERQAVLERSREHDTQIAALAERERIAQDLHDLLGQTLTVVALKSDVAAKLIDKDPARAKVEIEEIRAASRDALKNVREAVANMNQTTVQKEIQRATSILSSAGVVLTVNGAVPDLDTATDRTLGLAIREATTNIVRHAHATEATLDLIQTSEGFQLSIQDNGDGRIDKEGSGLAGLRKRIEQLGGRTVIDVDAGVRITLSLPA